MIFDERDRSAKLFIEAERIRHLTPQQSLEVFFDMNRAVLKVCTESVRAQNPKISGKGLLNEVKRIYSFREQ